MFELGTLLYITGIRYILYITLIHLIKCNDTNMHYFHTACATKISRLSTVYVQ